MTFGWRKWMRRAALALIAVAVFCRLVTNDRTIQTISVVLTLASLFAMSLSNEKSDRGGSPDLTGVGPIASRVDSWLPSIGALTVFAAIILYLGYRFPHLLVIISANHLVLYLGLAAILVFWVISRLRRHDHE
jgi:hypothetical protein